MEDSTTCSGLHSLRTRAAQWCSHGALYNCYLPIVDSFNFAAECMIEEG
jgi:hypothetical protein